MSDRKCEQCGEGKARQGALCNRCHSAKHREDQNMNAVGRWRHLLTPWDEHARKAGRVPGRRR